MTQNDEEVKTDLLLMINASTPRISSNESQSTSKYCYNTPVSEELLLMISSTNQQDDIPTRTQTNEFERKDEMSTKEIDDTALRIFPKAPKMDRFPQEKSVIKSSSPTDTEIKDKDEAINTQGSKLVINHL